MHISDITTIITKSCQVSGVALEDIFRKPAAGVARTLKPMVMYYLVRDLHAPHRLVAQAFGCNRFNVLALARAFGESMEFQPHIRRRYSDFLASIADCQFTLT